jgi:uncharacterized protein (TIGR03437 family)
MHGILHPEWRLRAIKRRLLLCSLVIFVCSSILFAQVDVLTANYDNNRTNANLSEFVLNKSNVNPAQFGKLYSLTIDGEAYAQPLYVRGVNFAGATVRNVLYVATMNNSVYAFDADAAASTAPLWHVNFGTPVNPHDFDYPADNSTTPPTPVTPYTDILNGIGILSTPVIDPATSTLYAVHYTYVGSGSSKQYAYYLHALDLATGSEKFGGPVAIQGSVTGSGWAGLDTPVNGQIAFDPGQHLQRPGLLLLYGNVYLGFGSHGDEGPWHGWLMAYDATTLQQTSIFNTSANNAAAGAIWQGGRGLAADGAANIYCSTGNGTWDGSAAWSESVLRLTTIGGIGVADFFTPAEWNSLNNNDTDVGSSGPALIPGTNLIYAIGKEGQLFLLDKTNLGHVATANAQVVQSFQAGNPTLTLTQEENSFLVFNTAFWDNIGGQLLYMWPFGQNPVSYRMKNGLFETTPYSSNATVVNHLPMPGISISAYGSLSSSGILWMTSLDSSNLPGPGTLHAFDALDLTVELWNSDMTGTRDTLGNFTKFANPTVANGKVFQASASGEIAVYGLLPNVPGIASVVDSASYSGSVVAPGELVTIFGTSIGPTTSIAASINSSSGTLPQTLGGVQVTFNGQPAPLLFGSAGQINAVAPFEIAGQSTVQLAITQANGQSLSTTLPVVQSNPSIFSANSSGTGQGAILNNADLTRNSATNPAARGSVIAIYATGAGVTKPASVDGSLTSTTNAPLVAQPVTVTIGGQNAQVLYQGAAPGQVAGIAQINVQIPTNITPGPSVPVTLAVGSTQSQNSVTIAVK